MCLGFDRKLGAQYKSPSQKVRVLTEDWVGSYIYCPGCGHIVSPYKRNKPVGDFYCSRCSEDFELKSKGDRFGAKIVDGAYRTMIERLQSTSNPSFFLLNYAVSKLEVVNFSIIPKHFFVPQIIERRKPLSNDAERAGWVGCNILLNQIPSSGRIFYIKDRLIQKKEVVLQSWRKTLFLRESKDAELKGWILDVMNCIDSLNKKEFSLQEMYGFEDELSSKHPGNKHIKDKIRQQLQFLRDRGYLDFIGKGCYRIR
ncbi:MAG: DpnI domain-containing protein [Candidatus Omnitrophota bacterium]|nr:DpnI domain-containing protein [Candidatus Omnitrophota bacterium]